MVAKSDAELQLDKADIRGYEKYKAIVSNLWKRHQIL